MTSLFYFFFNLNTGDWYNSNVEDITTEAQTTGGGPKTSDAFTINGLTSDLFNCTGIGMLPYLHYLITKTVFIH